MPRRLTTLKEEPDKQPRLTLRLDENPELYDRLVIYARKRQQGINAAVVDMIEEYFDRLDQKELERREKEIELREREAQLGDGHHEKGESTGGSSA